MFDFSTEISAASLGAAVRALRGKLGYLDKKGKHRPMQKDRFGELFGAKTATVSRWEKGKNAPPGDAVIKMLALCPDKETLALFGLRVAGGSTLRSAHGRSPEQPHDPEIDELVRNGELAIRLAADIEASGMGAAAELLRAFAQDMHRQVSALRVAELHSKTAAASSQAAGGAGRGRGARDDLIKK